MAAGLRVRELGLNQAWAGPLEEDEAQRPGPVEDPTSEEQRAQALEPDQSTVHLLSARETPTSIRGTGSEMLEEVSEPVPPDHRNQEIQLLVSRLFDLVLGKLSSQDRARPVDRVQASIVMENSSVMAQVEFCSSVERSRPDLAVVVEEAKTEEPARV